MSLVLLIILALILCGGIPAYRSGTLAIGSPFGIVLLIVILLLLFGLVGPYPSHRWYYWQ